MSVMASVNVSVMVYGCSVQCLDSGKKTTSLALSSPILSSLALLRLAKTTRADETVGLVEWYGDGAAMSTRSISKTGLDYQELLLPKTLKHMI